jgi:MerR family redox-sensitive transcriptional activator SoxR
MTTISIGDVARDSGASTSAVRFYEAHGLISATRTSGNQRRFHTDAACRIKAARVAQRIGLTVTDIRRLFAQLPPNPTPHDWHHLEDTLAQEAARRIAQLHEVLDDIKSDQKLCEL